MKKVLLALGAAALLLSAQLVGQQIDYANDQKAMQKTDEQLLGTHLYLPREDEEPVDVNFYHPEGTQTVPLIINLHGGAFIAGDADALDSQSDRLSRAWNCAFATVNYTLARDGVSIEYGTQEVVDTVNYFKAHAQEYAIDPEQIVLMGYSAGGCHAIMSALALKEEGVDVAAQVLCYPFISDAIEKYQKLTPEQQQTMAPALFVLADNDPISEGSLGYETALKDAGVSTEVLRYPAAKHGFLKETNPEYANLKTATAHSPEQEALAHQAEQNIQNWLDGILSLN